MCISRGPLTVLDIAMKRLKKVLSMGGVLVIAAGLLFPNIIKANAEETETYVSKPVKGRAVQIDPAKIKKAPPTPSSVTVPEGEPLPKGPKPKRKPIKDPVIQTEGAESSVEIFEVTESIGLISDPDVNIPGIHTGSMPPDTVGDVGPDHYVQMVNATQVQMWDKQGNSLLGPFEFGDLWPVDTPCETDGWGDPIVVYDHLADRWLLSQFDMDHLQVNPDGSRTPIGPFFMCIAISQTPDPTDGNWYLYDFPMDEFPDYPKFGVWPDGYYMSSNESDLGVYVFDRANMLLGNAAVYLRDDIPTLGTASVRGTRILPADLDGPPPPAGTPNFFVRTVDNQQLFGSPDDSIEIWEAAVDWTTLSFSFGNLLGLPDQVLTSLLDGLAPFQIMLCDRDGGGNRDCIPQPDGAGSVDALSNRPMMQLKYRNFGTHSAMVFNQTIDTSGSMEDLTGITPANEVAGIRWYELRSTGGDWHIFQQGTYAPQPIDAEDEDELLHRWMGSAAMDKDGNIALGYSIVNSDSDAGEQVYPGISYTGRLATDTLNMMAQGEKEIRVGHLAQDVAADGRRWGDYSSMSVDPVDDCTFWYTTHMAAGEPGSRTQIASFRFDTCATDLAISKNGPLDAFAGEEMFYDLSVTNYGPIIATNVTVVDTLPTGVSYLADTDSCVEDPIGTLTCDLGDLDVGDSVSFTIKVKIDSDLVADDGIETITNTATVSADQGDLDESDNTDSVITIVQDSSDLEVTKLCKPDQTTLPAGETGICEVFVDNLGPSYAREVVIYDEIVSDGMYTILSAEVDPAGDCTIDFSGLVTCALDDALAVTSPTTSGRAIMTVEITADEAMDVNDIGDAVSSTPDPDTTNNQMEGSISISAVADLGLTKSGDPATVVAGEILIYTLEVTNDGPSEAVNVLIEDVLPTGVTINSVGTIPSDAGDCNVGEPGDPNQPTTCGFDSMAAGDAATMVVEVTVLPDTRGILHNDARVSSDVFDPNNANDFPSVDTTVDAVADLVISKSDNPDPVLAGDLLTYTIDVTNNGPSTAMDVVLTDSLPPEVSFLGTTSPEGALCALENPGTVSCTLGDIDPWQTVTMFIEVRVDSSIPDETVIENTVTATSSTPDPDGATDVETTLVNAQADLWIDKTGNFPTGIPSEMIVYSLTVYNSAGCSEGDPLVCGDGGPSDALDIVVTDTLPSTAKKLVIEYVSESCQYDKAAHIVTCEEPVLAAGDSVVFEIHANPSGSIRSITNNTAVTSSTTDPNAGNNIDSLLSIVKGGLKN